MNIDSNNSESPRFLIKSLSFVAVVLTLTLAPQVGAAVKTQLSVQPRAILQNTGAVQGGAAGRLTSLLDLHSSTAKLANGSVERVVIDVGDEHKQKLEGRLGYYNVQLNNGRQIVVSFRQTLNANFDDREIMQKLAKSPFVKDAHVLFDPLNQTTSLVFDLKQIAKVHAYSVNGTLAGAKSQTGKLVMDLASIPK